MLLTGSIFQPLLYTCCVSFSCASLCNSDELPCIKDDIALSSLHLFPCSEIFEVFFAKLHIKNKSLLQETVGDLEAFLKLVYRVKNLVTHAH
jgi:hypothetical protein